METFDRASKNYFDVLTPEYSVERLEYACKFINGHCQPDSSLIDIGCGTGNILKYFKDNTPMECFSGIDISENYLEIMQQKLTCHTLRGSILDYDFAASITENLILPSWQRFSITW
ncbi:hypothetical protein CEE37_10505 [candidate division LCP-89 bacterium B3_LCP]|uniref:Methyltransferase domain-containing protein n=1 Tax=candidate division LCP-89 bacterium B3_LCP TaxID=2012998 RepID=A0A532UXN4_UNCL8|nr:MAG: hypothetical protein CEE37_10505 [candidate division LCP-89 bacterium B3_LCP]